MNGAVSLPYPEVAPASSELAVEDGYQRPANPLGYALLFVPFAIATLLTELPLASYLIAWEIGRAHV